MWAQARKAHIVSSRLLKESARTWEHVQRTSSRASGKTWSSQLIAIVILCKKWRRGEIDGWSYKWAYCSWINLVGWEKAIQRTQLTASTLFESGEGIGA